MRNCWSKLSLLLVAALSTLEPNADAMPTWAKAGGTSVHGQVFTAPCNGQGPSVAQARQDAINGCKASASQFLRKETTIRSVSIETERDVAFHQEVSDDNIYSNLRCIPEKEEIEGEKDGLWSVWVLCRIDLSVVDVVEANKNSAKDKSADIQSPALTTIGSRQPPKTDDARNVASDENRVVNVVSVPPCSEILVKGARARIERCSSGSTQIVTYRDDESLIVRARGYVPKTVKLSGKAWVNHEVVQVLLESE